MWPQLFGPGWEFGVLMAGALLAAYGCAVWFAIQNMRSLGPDPVTNLWRRYEQGDLTSWEAARLFRMLAGQRTEVERLGRRSGGAPQLRLRVPVWARRPREVRRTFG
jgi:hypothetical protein